MKKNETITAKKLTLEEIKTLPFASVIWYADENNNNGVIWNWKIPVVICVPGEFGVIVGGDESSIVMRDIDEHLLDDPDASYWDHEPDQSQLRGITEKEYNATPNEEAIIWPQLAEAITSRKIPFDRFCEQNGINFSRFWDAMTGKREFMRSDINAIRAALQLTDAETEKIFFPETAPAQI